MSAKDVRESHSMPLTQVRSEWLGPAYADPPTLCGAGPNSLASWCITPQRFRLNACFRVPRTPPALSGR
jgi:hypothetical protein